MVRHMVARLSRVVGANLSMSRAARASALEASVSKSGSAALADGLRAGASRRRAGRPEGVSSSEERRWRGERDLVEEGGEAEARCHPQGGRAGVA